uniref:Niban apoptosis regulator 2b n=1 Tax=Scleropages formosus TaxID=113540 RepID=A0A8C9T1U3_SCLFO
MGEFGRLYEQQYPVALFNSVRFEIEGNISPQSQLLHRKAPLEDKSIFSGMLFQYLEENKKWRNRFFFVPDSYVISYYENKLAYDRGLHPKGAISLAGYRVLGSLEKYLELLETTLPGVKAKAGSAPPLKCATQFPILLWHPYARHHYFCVTTEKEQQKWLAVFQDCVRHTNNGLSEDCKVQTPAFTDAVRLYRQARGQYSTWEMMCGTPTQILANLVMENLVSELRDLIAVRLKGKAFDRQRNWMLISDAVYSLVQEQVKAQYEAVLQKCEAGRPPLEATIRTDMDQIVTSKEHVTSKMCALVLPKADKLLKASIQPYISSVLEALMEPTSRGFAEVRDVFFRELVDVSKNMLNGGSKEKLGEVSLSLSPSYFTSLCPQQMEKVEQLHLEGLQQRFDVPSTSVFIQRAQILMREQMDNAVYTFEQILHQSLEGHSGDDLAKIIQRCQDRVIKKYDYDSSTVRKKFFREALLQIFIPYMLKQLSPPFAAELPRFRELIFEDFSRFILVENIFEEVVLQSIMKDIMMAVKEAAVQRRHNLYRDSIVLNNSDPNLHLLDDNPTIDWTGEYGGQGDHTDSGESHKRRRMKQVVSMIQVDGSHPLPYESCLEVPGVGGIVEEGEGKGTDTHSAPSAEESHQETKSHPESAPPLTNGTGQKEDGQKVQADPPKAVAQKEEEMRPPTESAPQAVEKKSPPTESAPQAVEKKSPPTESAPQAVEKKSPPTESAPQAVEKKSPPTESAPQAVERKVHLESPIQDAASKSAIESAIQEIENAVLGEDSGLLSEPEEQVVHKSASLNPELERPAPGKKQDTLTAVPESEKPPGDSQPHEHKEAVAKPSIPEGDEKAGAATAHPEQMAVTPPSDSETGEEVSGKEPVSEPGAVQEP